MNARKFWVSHTVRCKDQPRVLKSRIFTSKILRDSKSIMKIFHIMCEWGQKVGKKRKKIKASLMTSIENSFLMMKTKTSILFWLELSSSYQVLKMNLEYLSVPHISSSPKPSQFHTPLSSTPFIPQFHSNNPSVPHRRFWGLKRSGHFVLNWCVELRGCGTEGDPWTSHRKS